MGPNDLKPPPIEWMIQAESDYAASERVLIGDDPSSFCQAISKYQQSVEKSVKALAAFLGIDVGYKHEVEPLIFAMRRKLKGGKWVTHRVEIDPFLLVYENEINAICRLAPLRPEPGKLHERNTEYPFELEPGVWRAPARPGTFNDEDVQRFRRLSREVTVKVRNLVYSIQRARGIS